MVALCAILKSRTTRSTLKTSKLAYTASFEKGHAVCYFSKPSYAEGFEKGVFKAAVGSFQIGLQF